MSTAIKQDVKFQVEQEPARTPAAPKRFQWRIKGKVRRESPFKGAEDYFTFTQVSSFSLLFKDDYL